MLQRRSNFLELKLYCNSERDFFKIFDFDLREIIGKVDLGLQIKFLPQASVIFIRMARRVITAI